MESEVHVPVLYTVHGDLYLLSISALFDLASARLSSFQCRKSVRGVNVLWSLLTFSMSPEDWSTGINS